MSKSKGNVVTPDEYIKTYGCDALRLYLMFMGPFSQGGDFRDTSMEGMARWIGRVWRMGVASIEKRNEKDGQKDKDLERAMNKLIQKITDDAEKRRYNTAIASMMEYTNTVADSGGTLPGPLLEKFLLILAPFAPFITEELWQRMHGKTGTMITKKDSIHSQPWPTAGKVDTSGETVTVIVQVNGKLRDRLILPRTDAENKTKLQAAALSAGGARTYLSKGKLTKTIVVPGKLVNFVVL